VSSLAILSVGLKRVARDRTALFFMVVLPIAVILIIGATVRGFNTIPVGVVDEGAGSSGHELVTALEQTPDLKVTHYPDLAAARTAVARDEIDTAVILPAHMDAELRAGKPVDVMVLAEPTNSVQQAAAQAVGAVVAHQGSRVQAALFASAQVGGTFERNLRRAASTEPKVAQVAVASTSVDNRATTLPQGFSYSAPTMLVLFVFLNALAGGATIIETRRAGMYERMAASPARIASIVTGEAATYVTIALVQSVLIVLVGAVVFGVSWGNPLGAAALVVVWAVVGGGAGMLAGTVFHTPEQASSIGPAAGIAMAMLGGCMWPLSIVSTLMREIGHVTPQAWAVDAWTDLLSRGGTFVSVAPDLGILAAFACGFLVLATRRLHRVFA
jgi:ABC-2 type transport system permease protein